MKKRFRFNATGILALIYCVAAATMIVTGHMGDALALTMAFVFILVAIR